MVTELAVLDVLRTIDDPEMPINIVDLGIVDAVRVDHDEDTSDAVKRSRTTADGGTAKIAIDILPTFVGCPALPAIENEIRKRVHRLAGVGEIDVNFKFDPPWTVDRISPAGRDALRKFGITVPDAGQQVARIRRSHARSAARAR